MRIIINNPGLAFGTSNRGTFAAVILSLFTLSQAWAQEVIKANGPGNTYDELTAFLAPVSVLTKAPFIPEPPISMPSTSMYA